jgi:hypothetical protein
VRVAVTGSAYRLRDGLLANFAFKSNAKGLGAAAPDPRRYVRQQLTEAAHVAIRPADWAIAEMIGLNEKGLGTFRGPLPPLAYIRPNDRYPHHVMHFLDKLRPAWVLNEGVGWAPSSQGGHRFTERRIMGEGRVVTLRLPCRHHERLTLTASAVSSRRPCRFDAARAAPWRVGASHTGPRQWEAFSRDAERWQPAVLMLTACVPLGYPKIVPYDEEARCTSVNTSPL